MHAARRIPSIDRLRQRPAIRALEARYGATAVVSALRTVAERLRETLATSAQPVDTADDDTVAANLEAAAASHLTALDSRLRRVINATGVIVHTNLGRAPVAAEALQRVADVASGYVAIEYDLEAGARGRRDVHAEPLLCQLTGAEAGLVVNNNAAATLLMLTALAQGREVIVSRGELVEIGGGFRVPDIMRQSGAVLREVGTTNRTRAADYAAAIGDRTAVLLRVHPSNFTIEGFTARPSLGELRELADRFRLPLVEDLGSGLLDAAGAPLDEPTVNASLRAGVHLVAFSGDKLLGGPQAGILVGRRELVDTLRRHPLMRALRADKMTYAALEATLALYAAGAARDHVPVVEMMSRSLESLDQRARALAATLADSGVRATIRDGHSAIGGGSAPGERLATRLIALEVDGFTPDALATKLRQLPTPIIARIADDHVVLDLRTVAPADDAIIATQLASIAGERKG